MNSLFVAVANFSQTAVWVFGILLVAEFVALFVYVYRSGNADEEEGRVVVLVGRKYRSRMKVFVNLSSYVSCQQVACGTHLSLGQLILELDQEAGIKQQHHVIGAAAPQRLGLRRPSWHRADRRRSVRVAPKAHGG